MVGCAPSTARGLGHTILPFPALHLCSIVGSKGHDPLKRYVGTGPHVDSKGNVYPSASTVLRRGLRRSNTILSTLYLLLLTRTSGPSPRCHATTSSTNLNGSSSAPSLCQWAAGPAVMTTLCPSLLSPPPALVFSSLVLYDIGRSRLPLRISQHLAWGLLLLVPSPSSSLHYRIPD